jgi:hypothetical protein
MVSYEDILKAKVKVLCAVNSATPKGIFPQHHLEAISEQAISRGS